MRSHGESVPLDIAMGDHIGSCARSLLCPGSDIRFFEGVEVQAEAKNKAHLDRQAVDAPVIAPRSAMCTDIDGCCQANTSGLEESRQPAELRLWYVQLALMVKWSVMPVIGAPTWYAKEP